MGFGIMFVGYALAIGSTYYGTYFFGDVIGGVIMLLAFLKLRQYERSFVASAAASAGYSLICGASAVMALMGYADESISPELIGAQVFAVIQVILPIVVVALYICMLLPMIRLAGSVGLVQLRRRTVWVLSLIFIYTAAYLVLYFAGDRIAEASVKVYNGYASVIGLFQIVYYLIMLVLILSFLKWVVPAEVAEAEQNGTQLANESLLTKLGGRINAFEEKVRSHKKDGGIDDISADANDSPDESKSDSLPTPNGEEPDGSDDGQQ